MNKYIRHSECGKQGIIDYYHFCKNEKKTILIINSKEILIYLV